MSDAANAIDISGTVTETSKIPPPPDTGQIGAEELRRRVAQKYEGESPFPEHWKPMLPLVWIGLLFLAIYGIGDWGTMDTWFGETGPQPTATLPWMMYRWNHDQSATHGWLVLPIAIACIYYKRAQTETNAAGKQPERAVGDGVRPLDAPFGSPV